MKIELDGKSYELSPALQMQLLRQFQEIGLQKYAELEKPLRLTMKTVAREILRRMEKKAGKGIRPPDGEDVVLHLVNLFLAVVMQGLNHATATVTTDQATATITHLALSIEDQGASGG